MGLKDKHLVQLEFPEALIHEVGTYLHGTQLMFKANYKTNLFWLSR